MVSLHTRIAKSRSYLLHGLRTHAEDDATERSGAGSLASLTAEEIGPGDGVLPLVLDSPLDILGLCLDVGVVDRAVFQVCENLLCLSNASLCEEPAGDR